jgi:hypothetical protein
LIIAMFFAWRSFYGMRITSAAAASAAASSKKEASAAAS